MLYVNYMEFTWCVSNFNVMQLLEVTLNPVWSLLFLNVRRLSSFFSILWKLDMFSFDYKPTKWYGGDRHDWGEGIWTFQNISPQETNSTQVWLDSNTQRRNLMVFAKKEL